MKGSNLSFKSRLIELARKYGLKREWLIFVTDIKELRLEADRWNSKTYYKDTVSGCCLKPDSNDSYDHPVVILIEKGSSENLKCIRNHFRDTLALWYPAVWDDYESHPELFLEFLLLHELGHMILEHEGSTNKFEHDLIEQEANQWASLELRKLYGFN